jgi:hypothetical protein
MVWVVATRLAPVPCKGGKEKLPQLTQRLEERGEQAHHLLDGVLVRHLEGADYVVLTVLILVR